MIHLLIVSSIEERIALCDREQAALKLSLRSVLLCSMESAYGKPHVGPRRSIGEAF